jgi:hypothetical protein
MISYVVCGHLHPFLEIGQQRHDALPRRDGGSGNIGHVMVLLRRRVWAVLPGCERYALSTGRRGGGSKGIALGFLLCMAAGGFLLAVVVEGYSARCKQGDGNIN